MNAPQHSSQLEPLVSSNGQEFRTRDDSSPRSDVQPAAEAELSPELAWSQQNLLSLDGGGIRGYWTLLVLQQLMKCVAQEELRQKTADEEHHSFYPSQWPAGVTQGGLDDEEKMRKQAAQGARVPTHEVVHDARKFLPCHYFDYICGSSTGALIAIMLGRFRMTVWDCLQEYEKMSHSIFGKPRLISQRNIGIVPWPKYSAKALEKAFQLVTARRCEVTTRSQITFPSPPGVRKPVICKTFVTAYAYERKKNAPVSEQRLYLLRTYEHKVAHGVLNRGSRRTNTGNNSDDRLNYMYGAADDWQIWRVARAATAAPMYFKELPDKRHMIDGKSKKYYSDGGFGQTNNPTYEGIREIRLLHGEENLGAVVNVGTSRGRLEAGGKSIFKRVKGGFDRATDPQVVVKQVNSLNLPDHWRFDDEKGIEIELDEWKPNGYFTKHPGARTLDKITNKFNAWAVVPANSEFLANCAAELVRRRRMRISNPAQWEVYATNASFACDHNACRSTAFNDRTTLENHFRHTHSIAEHELKSMVDQATRMWQYQTL